MTTSTKNHRIGMRLSAGVMVALLSLPALAGPCSTYANGIRQGQLQRIGLQKTALHNKMTNLNNISQQMMGCWDMVVGIDVGSFGMPPAMTKIAINRLNQACEAAIQRAVTAANGAIGEVTGQLGSALNLGGLGGAGGGMLSQLSQTWGQLTPMEQSEALKAMDQMAPGTSSAFMQAQQGSMTSSLPSIQGPGTVTTSTAKSILGQVGEFFSPSAP